MTGRAPRVASVLLGAGLALLLSVATAAPAAAHSAALAYQGTAGPYTIWAYQGTRGDTPATIAYTVALRVSATGAPVDDATATVTAATPDTSDSVGQHAGPVTATPIANLYQYVLPDPGPHNWTVQLLIRASAGTATATFAVTGLINRAPAQFHISAWVPTAAALLVLTGLATWSFRGRRPQHPSAPQPPRKLNRSAAGSPARRASRRTRAPGA
jgi:hypothetical protein